MSGERRAFAPDQEKFSTQRTVTYVLLLIFASTAGWVLYQNDQSERSMVLQTVINLTLLAVGYWLGASKQGQDQAQTMSKLAEQAAPSQEKAVAAARAPALDSAPALSPAPVTEPVPVKIVEGAGTPGNAPLNVEETPK